MKELAFSAPDPEFWRHSFLDAPFSSLAYFRQPKWQIGKEPRAFIQHQNLSFQYGPASAVLLPNSEGRSKN